MNDRRKHEIAYLLLKQQLQRDGLVLNARFKEQLNNAHETLSIPVEEIDAFALLIAQDAYKSTDAAPV